jgi:hypothetical protein
LGAVVVIIGGHHAHAIQGHIEAALVCDIPEGAIALVAIEAHGGLWLLALPRDCVGGGAPV